MKKKYVICFSFVSLLFLGQLIQPVENKVSAKAAVKPVVFNRKEFYDRINTPTPIYSDTEEGVIKNLPITNPTYELTKLNY